MNKIKIAVLCPSEIAFRRFMPALKDVTNVEYIGIGVANEEEWFGNKSIKNNLTILENEYNKCLNFKKMYGGKIFESYEELMTSNEIDAIYIPLPPALHYKWAKKALECGKHVFVEKPSTTSLKDTKELVEIANTNDLAIHENYMFNFHLQLDYIEKLIEDKIIGDIRLYRIAFGFPFRGANDFRYNKKLGGGALLDCGGYTLKLATRFLGNTAKLVTHQLNYKDGFDVDVYGSGTLVNSDGMVAQVSFGMDNSYKCELEVWGEKGTIYTNRILTAPEGYKPIITIKTNNDTNDVVLESDDSFKKSIIHFINCINDESVRKLTYDELIKQASIVEAFKED